MKRIIIAIITVTGLAGSSFATIINVPADYSTIQTGINASTDGDTVLVQPGTYVENINFNGHNIVLGSLFLTTGDTLFIHSTIISESGSDGNVAFENGEDSTTAIIGFTIQDGNAIEGAGIYCYNSGPIIRNNVIKNNRAEGGDSGGGGIACINSSPLIESNVIYGNYGYLAGGGIGCRDNSNPRIINNTIYGNSTGPNFGGGGLVCINSNPLMINNTISHNSGYVGGIRFYNSSPIIKNNIVWGNAEPQILEYLSDPQVTYCDIEGGYQGEGILDTDPLFRDPDNGDFHLMSTACGDPFDSPCIDTGDPSIDDIMLDCSWGLGAQLSDMGAYGGGDSVMVDIDDPVTELPDRFTLLQNYPNPFNPSTTIRYSLPEQSDVLIEIYNILGQTVATLFDGNQQAGYHTITWQADDYPSGVYFARLEAGARLENIKMVLLK